jgi:transposase
VLDEAGKRVGSRRFAHSHEGLNELKQFLLSRAASPDQLACIVETHHGLLITFLLEAGIPVYPVNPKTANQLRKAAGAKTDQIDAHLLAKIGCLELAELRRLEPDSALVQELKTLTRDQDALIQTQTRLVNQLTACLKEYYPAQGQAYQPEAGSSKVVEELRRPQLVASEVMVRAKARLMLSLVKQLLVVIEEIASYDKVIHTLFLTHNDQAIWRSLPGAGKRLAPRRLPEWGEDRSRYADASSVQTLAGTAPVPFQSGNYAKAHKRFACVKPLRNALHQFAWQSTRQEAWALAYYRRKRAEGKTHSMALRALANVWVRIIYRMWVNKTSYQTAIFEAARLSHAPSQHVA